MTKGNDTTSQIAVREVLFHGTKLLVRPGDGPDTTLVAMKPIVEGMGLDWGGQHKKLLGHPVLSKGISVMETPSAGGTQAMTALPLNRLHFWMATLHPNKITDPAVRERVIIYQTEAADALFERFFGAAIHAPVSSGQIGRQVAAIVESKLQQALKLILPSMLDDRLAADERAVAIGFKPALMVLLEKKVPSRGRRAFSQKVSARLRRFSAERDHPFRISRESGRYLFHVDAISDWLVAEGDRMIRDHVAGLDGQGVLRLVPPPAATPTA